MFPGFSPEYFHLRTQVGTFIGHVAQILTGHHLQQRFITFQNCIFMFLIRIRTKCSTLHNLKQRVYYVSMLILQIVFLWVACIKMYAELSSNITSLWHYNRLLIDYTWRECDMKFCSVTHGGSMIQNLQSGLLYLLGCIVYRSLISLYRCFKISELHLHASYHVRTKCSTLHNINWPWRTALPASW